MSNASQEKKEQKHGLYMYYVSWIQSILKGYIAYNSVCQTFWQQIVGNGNRKL